MKNQFSFLANAAVGYLAGTLPECATVLCSFPKCGNTWLKNILALILFSKFTTEDVVMAEVWPELSPRLFLRDPDRFRDAALIKSHYSPRTQLHCKELYLCRRPTDVAHSLFDHIEREIGTQSINDFERAFIKGKLLRYGQIRQHLENALWRAERNELMFIFYERINGNSQELRRVIRFLGWDVPDDTIERAISMMTREAIQQALQNVSDGSESVSLRRSEFFRPKRKNLNFSDAMLHHLEGLDKFYTEVMHDCTVHQD